MDAILTELGPVNVVAGAAVLFGVFLLVMALRALTNAALALRARLFALGTAGTLLGVGAGRPFGLEVPLTETLFSTLTDALARWMDSPVEMAAVVAGLVLLGGLILGLILLYYWIRALMRMAWIAFVGLCLLGVSLTVVLAAEGVVPVPDPLRDTFVLAAIVAMLLIAWGVVRLLQRAVAPAPRT